MNVSLLIPGIVYSPNSQALRIQIITVRGGIVIHNSTFFPVILVFTEPSII